MKDSSIHIIDEENEKKKEEDEINPNEKLISDYNNKKKRNIPKKNMYKNGKEYTKDIINGNKCSGINACCYLFGTLMIAIPLGIGISITFKINSNDNIIPFLIIAFSLLFLIISNCLCYVFNLISKNDDDDNYGYKGNNDNDTFLSCCIKLSKDEATEDLNMFVYVICFLIIATPIGIAIGIIINWKIRNYVQVGVLLIVFSVVGLAFLLLTILILKLKGRNKNDDDDIF